MNEAPSARPAIYGTPGFLFCRRISDNDALVESPFNALYKLGLIH